MYSRIVLQSLCASVLLLLHVFVHSNPIVNEIGGKQSWIIDGIMSAVRNDPTLRKMESASSEHAFIKLDAPRNQAEIQANGTITVEGDSSMQLFNQMDINRARFNPDYFLESVGNEAARPVEVSPAAGQPYFMFISSPLLKNQSLRKSIFSNIGKRRIKRHHPNPLQNVLGELQNYALVPIKSSNGQIRYILLKNPKFVIGNPADIGQSGQPAPAIIQLNSNFAAPMPRGSIRYTPKLPQRPVTPPTFRRNPQIQIERLPRPVPIAGPIDSNFATPTRNSPRRFPGIAASNSFSSPRVSNSASTSQVQSIADSRFSNVGHVHSHSHGSPVAVAQAVGGVGDTTVHKTEVVETVVETQSKNAAVTKQEVAQASSAASQSIISPTETDIFGNLGVAAVDTAAAASSQTSAASSATAAKAEKVQKKTKKTTTTVVKSGGSNSAGGVIGGEVHQIQQVVEETIHKAASSSSAAASSEVASAASSSSAAGTNSIVDTLGSASGTIATSAASATNASSSASSAETNSTSIKKITTKTTIITKSKASDTGAIAVINSKIPKSVLSSIEAKPTAVLSNLEAKPVAAIKPPTAILSGSNDKKATIDSKAVLIATVKPKLVAPIIAMDVTSSTTVSTTEAASTEEPEIEAEEVITTVKASATEPTTYPPTYPTTTYPYLPTTYPTTEYNYFEPFVTNPPRRRMSQSRQRPGGPRASRRNRNRQPPWRGGRRHGRRGRMNGEEYVPRDPITRWLFNNMDGEGLESLLPLFALG